MAKLQETFYTGGNICIYVGGTRVTRCLSFNYDKKSGIAIFDCAVPKKSDDLLKGIKGHKDLLIISLDKEDSKGYRVLFRLYNPSYSITGLKVEVNSYLRLAIKATSGIARDLISEEEYLLPINKE